MITKKERPSSALAAEMERNHGSWMVIIYTRGAVYKPRKVFAKRGTIRFSWKKAIRVEGPQHGAAHEDGVSKPSSSSKSGSTVAYWRYRSSSRDRGALRQEPADLRASLCPCLFQPSVVASHELHRSISYNFYDHAVMADVVGSRLKSEATIIEHASRCGT